MMSTGVASSSPQDCLNLIKTNITAAHAAIASAEQMASPASGDSPLEVFLTVMGVQARNIVSTLTLKDDRFLEASKGNKSHRDDDLFAELVNLQKHIFKCAESYPPVGNLVPEETRQAAKNKMSGHLRDLCNIIAGVIRQETFDKVRQVESSSIGEARFKCSSSIDKIHAQLVIARKQLVDIESSIDDFTKLKTPQSNMRDQRVLECEESWSFTHDSYTTRSSLGMELDSAEAERKKTNQQKNVTYQTIDGANKTEKWKAADKAAALKVIDDRIKILKHDIKKEKEKIQERMRGSDAKVSPNDVPMVWPDVRDGEDIYEGDYCKILAQHLSNFMAGREHLFPLPFQAITRLLCDYVPYGDKKGQFDHANLPFDDAQIPQLRTDFTTQDKSLFRLWEQSGIPEYLKSAVLGGGVIHNMGKTPKEVYNVTESSACSFTRAILLVRKPLSSEHRRLLDNDMKSISSSFKKGSPLQAVQTSLTGQTRSWCAFGHGSRR